MPPKSSRATPKSKGTPRSARKAPEVSPVKEEEIKLPMKRIKPEEETRIDLGDNRFVSVSTYRGRSYVDMREFFFLENGELRPTKKGIALKPAEWKQLISSADRVNSDLKKAPKNEE